MTGQEAGACLDIISACGDDAFTSLTDLFFIQGIGFQNDLEFMTKRMSCVCTCLQVCRYFIIFAGAELAEVCDDVDFTDTVIFSDDVDLRNTAFRGAVAEREVGNRTELCDGSAYIRLTEFNVCRVDADGRTSKGCAVFGQINDLLLGEFRLQYGIVNVGRKFRNTHLTCFLFGFHK